MPDIKTLAAARNVDLVDTFTKSIAKLAKMLSACDPIKANVGETLHQKKITGKLSEAEYVEGQEIPESKYTWADVTTYEVAIKPYRKKTTLQEIKKRGYEAAVDATDSAMISDIQRGIKKDFVNVLAGKGTTGTTAVTGKNLVATAANAWAALDNLVEDYSFGDVDVIYFVNPVDFAKQIADSEVFSAFGISYIENWAGLGTLVSTGSVAAGTIYATVKNNVKVYTASTEGDDLFGFYTDESGYIAINHSSELKSLAYDTVAYTGITFFAEYIDMVVKGTIAATA